MKNTLGDLNNYLFESLENIENAETKEELEKEFEKAKVKTLVAEKIIDNAKVVLEGYKIIDVYGEKENKNIAHLISVK